MFVRTKILCVRLPPPIRPDNLAFWPQGGETVTTSGMPPLDARLPGGEFALADQMQAGYQLGHPLAIAPVVIGKLGQHEPLFRMDLELNQDQVDGKATTHRPAPASSREPSIMPRSPV